MNYLLFAGSNYYPEGGWHDFIGYFDSIDRAKTLLDFKQEEWQAKFTRPSNLYDWWHIVNQAGEIVAHQNMEVT